MAEWIMGFRRLVAAGLLGAGLMSWAAAASAQTVTLPGPPNNSQNALMFDVQAVNALTVTALSTAIDTAGTQTFQIYGRAGSHVGNSSSLAGWTLLGTSAALTAAAADQVLDLGVALNVPIAAGQSHAFMIRTLTDTTPLVAYQDAAAAVGGIAASDANLRVLIGTGGSWDLSTNFSPRQLVGAVRYTLGAAPPATVQPVPTLSQWTLIGLTLLLAGLAWRRRSAWS